MDNPIRFYQQRLNLQNATFSRIEHEEAIVSLVYKVIKPDGTQLILKVSHETNPFLREVYFLTHFAGLIPVPRIIGIVPPETDVHGAILMECLPGGLLKITDYTDGLAFEMGSLLAQIHTQQVTGYGDLVHPNKLGPDPKVPFTLKFEEELDECIPHLPKQLIKQCRSYFDAHLYLLDSVDGPCMVHRDFRPGNVIVHEGKIKGIIDWARGRGSFAEEDFVSMEHSEWVTDGKTKKSFLAGYASIRPVPDYSSIMPLLRLHLAITILGYTVKIGTWKNRHGELYHFNRKFLDQFF